MGVHNPAGCCTVAARHIVVLEDRHILRLEAGTGVGGGEDPVLGSLLGEGNLHRSFVADRIDRKVRTLCI